MVEVEVSHYRRKRERGREKEREKEREKNEASTSVVAWQNTPAHSS